MSGTAVFTFNHSVRMPEVPRPCGGMHTRSPFPRLHLCPFQTWLKLVCHPDYHPLNWLVQLPLPIQDSLQWWMLQGNVYQGIPFAQSPPTRIIVTDASLIGWVAHLRSLKVQGLWLEQKASLHIKVLELLAIYNACRGLRDHIRDLAVHILTSNTTMYYVNRQRTAHTNMLCQEVIKLWQFCIRETLSPWLIIYLDPESLAGSPQQKFLPESLMVHETPCPVVHSRSLGHPNCWPVHHGRQQTPWLWGSWKELLISIHWLKSQFFCETLILS